ncbi:MAG: hypothetical protein GY761_17365 [Hyphomicrobiales bacterium]|nr:hypothetical protein [Hyphomicrobiales bacterium]
MLAHHHPAGHEDHAAAYLWPGAITDHDEKEFRANVVGIAQMYRSELSEMVGESPYEAQGFVNIAKEQAAKLRGDLALLEWGIGRVQLHLDDVDWETATLSIKTLERVTRAVCAQRPEVFKNSDKN